MDEAGRPDGKTALQVFTEIRTALAFAGIWKEGEEGKEMECAVITTGPNEIVERVHNRMPASLKPEMEADQLDLDITLGQALELL